ncbi:MAG: penicillin-binding protein 2 [Armatimonadota bacterium]|jgi:penicillin-binding protein 2
MRLHDIPAPQAPEEIHRARQRARLAQLFVAALFLVLLGRLWYLQIAQGEALHLASEQNRIRKDRRPAPRGEILDRRGAVLASTRPKFVVTVDPDVFRAEGPEARRLAECLGMSIEEVRARIKPPAEGYRRVRVAVDIPRETLNRLMEMRPWLPGVSVDLEELRYYPQGKLAGHLLGYIGPIPERLAAQYKEKGYPPDARIGITGLEKTYEEELRGRDGGLVVEVDAMGRRTRLLREEEPSPGADLVTTINAAVQRAAEEGLTGKVGSAVALDPRTGEVLALASRPGYDPNLFARGIRVKEWEAIRNDKRLPLLNRAVQSVYAPGSTFKTISALAGLEGGVITQRSAVSCAGAYYLGRKRFGCWKRHGHTDFFDAIAESCDVFFYQMSRRLGVDPIADLARRLGLGERTGIDLPGERKGTVPSTAWKRQAVRRDPTWHPGDTLNTAIGQGYLQTSSLQMALVTGAIAMKGKVYRPHLVREIRSGGQVKRVTPELVSEVRLNGRNYDLVIEGMRQCVLRGTGRASALPGISVGGKTGSAQNPAGKAHAWFVAVAPLEDPQIAVCVMVEHGGHGSTAAAPVARAMLAAHFGLASAGAAPRVSGD